MPIPQPKQSESENEFMQRCMSDEKMISEYPTEQRAAICRSAFDEQLAATKVSFMITGMLSMVVIRMVSLSCTNCRPFFNAFL